MTMPKLPFSLPDVVRYPLHVVVYLLLTYFVFKEFTRGSECDDLREEIKHYKGENAQYKANQDALTNALLISQGINIKQAIEKKELDSTIREQLGEKAKRIISGK